MELKYIFLVVLMWLTFACCVCDDQQSTPGPKKSKTTVTTPTISATNATNTNETKPYVGLYDKMIENKGMLMRAFYVLLAVTSIVVIYFGIKAWRTRRRRNKSRKYGLITSSADLEMEPLDNDDDEDEDMTVFERRK